MIKILGISGSLRANSSATSVLKQAATFLPAEVEFSIYDGLGNLPHFNDSNNVPPEVLDFRNKVAMSDGIFICTPEYAFGVPGTLKNALDWTVGTGEFDGKPVALITASTGGEKAHASLLLTLKAISANVDERATLLISFIRSKLNEKKEIADPVTLGLIKDLLKVFVDIIRQ